VESAELQEFVSYTHWDHRSSDIFGKSLRAETNLKIYRERALADPSSLVLNTVERAPHYLTSRMADKPVAMRAILATCVSPYLPTHAMAAHHPAAYSVLNSARYAPSLLPLFIHSFVFIWIFIDLCFIAIIFFCFYLFILFIYLFYFLLILVFYQFFASILQFLQLTV
jgi:hypothetical protein